MNTSEEDEQVNQITPGSSKHSMMPAWFRNDGESFNAMQEAFDQFIERMTHGLPWDSRGPAVSARADLKETDDELVMTVDLPGFEENDVDVALADNRLTIKAHTEHKEEKQKGDYHFCERRVGDMSRMITLPCEVEADEVQAMMKNGVLTVSLPKSNASRAQTKHIDVKRAK